MLLEVINEIYDEVEEIYEKKILNEAIETKDKNKIKKALIKTLFIDWYSRCGQCNKIYANKLMTYDCSLKKRYCAECSRKKYDQRETARSKIDLPIVLSHALIHLSREEVKQTIDICFKQADSFNKED